MTKDEKQKLVEACKAKRNKNPNGDKFERGKNSGILMCTAIINSMPTTEEAKETNYQHYKKDVKALFCKMAIREMSAGDVLFKLQKISGDDIIAQAESMFCTDAILDWLYKPYVPKPDYELTEFERDLLESVENKKFSFYNTPVLIEMQRKGYFKDIPNDVSIEDILKSCE